MATTKSKPPSTMAQVAVVEAPKKSNGLLAYEGFQAEIQERADELASQLPSNVSRDRFINGAIAAVKQTPSLLKATPRSIFAALTKAAQDGLLPDGREGVITVYNQKISGTSKYEDVAQWNPMTYGLRKRARELDGIIIDTQVVYANDLFEREQGDDPKIVHKPAPLDEERGVGIGAYAIFKHPTEGILHREVMSKAEIETARNQSRVKDSLMWTKFWTEGWRKTVARRGIKSVPVSAALERMIQREDDNFDFNNHRDVTPAAHLTPPEPPAESLDGETAGNAGDKGADAGIPLDGQLHNSDQPEGVENEVEPFDMAGLGVALAGAWSEEEVEAAFDEFSPQTALVDDDDALGDAFALKSAALERVKRTQQGAENGNG